LKIEGDCSYQQIAPLLLIVFVENCFKHYSYNKTDQGFIILNFRITEHILELKIKNSSDPLLFSQSNIPNRKGIGLVNVRKRLNIIYPKKHTLILKKEPDFFEVHLKINLCLI